MTNQPVAGKRAAHSALEGRLRQVMELKGWSPRYWSIQSGCSGDAIRNIMRDKSSSPRIDTLERLAKYAGTTVDWLRGSTAQGAPDSEEEIRPGRVSQGQLPLIGYIGAGEVVYHFGIGEARETVAAPPDVTRGIAAEVRGASMLPVYRPGDLVIGREHEGGMEQLIGRDCFVQVAGGALYLKILRKAARGAFHLDSYNSAVPRIENQAVEWAAPVVWVKRS